MKSEPRNVSTIQVRTRSNNLQSCCCLFVLRIVKLWYSSLRWHRCCCCCGYLLWVWGKWPLYVAAVDFLLNDIEVNDAVDPFHNNEVCPIRNVSDAIFSNHHHYLAAVTTTDTSKSNFNHNHNTTHYRPVLNWNTDCRVVMARSVIPDAGWGVFAIQSLQRGDVVVSGDVVHHLIDLENFVHDSNNNNNNNNTIDPVADTGKVLQKLFWDAEGTAGYQEAKHVVSLVPGIGSLASCGKNATVVHTLPPLRPHCDEAGWTRLQSSLAGSSTHYHNYTFYMQTNLHAGQEIYAPCGYRVHWNDQSSLTQTQSTNKDIELQGQGRNVDWLRQYGACLDHLRPGVSTMRGRGAYAQRFLPQNSRVAPVPVLPLHRQAIGPSQLLLNYCFGHNESSLLLYPYGPMVNLINHGELNQANVILQWSQSPELFDNHTDPHWFFNFTIQDLIRSWLQPPPKGILLELVALRDIPPGTEILLDYGANWIRAMDQHMKSWQPVPGAESYAPSYVYNDAIQRLRTEKELTMHPYPDNVYTSCYYRIYDNQEHIKSSNDEQHDSVEAFVWKLTNKLLEPKNLRPCSVLQRSPDNQFYTVRMRNRPGLPLHERIKGLHIVTKVPRQAIRFTDKMYTTDQHLQNAFRQEIGVPELLFPDKWKDFK